MQAGPGFFKGLLVVDKLATESLNELFGPGLVSKANKTGGHIGNNRAFVDIPSVFTGDSLVRQEIGHGGGLECVLQIQLENKTTLHSTGNILFAASISDSVFDVGISGKRHTAEYTLLCLFCMG